MPDKVARHVHFAATGVGIGRSKPFRGHFGDTEPAGPSTRRRPASRVRDSRHVLSGDIGGPVRPGQTRGRRPKGVQECTRLRKGLNLRAEGGRFELTGGVGAADVTKCRKHMGHKGFRIIARKHADRKRSKVTPFDPKRCTKSAHRGRSTHRCPHGAHAVDVIAARPRRTCATAPRRRGRTSAPPRRVND